MKQTVVIEIGKEVVDIPTLESYSQLEYRDYMEGHLLYTDHHGALRAVLGDYPLAVTRDQIDTLIDYLRSKRNGLPAG